MPAAMEGWRSSGGSSKEELEAGETLTGGSGGDALGKGGSELEAAVAPAPAMVAAGSKRQRRPSVRLGEIGDLKTPASKSESLNTVRWITPDFMTKKSGRGPGKLPRTRPLANVSHRGDMGQVLGSPKAGAKDRVASPAPARGPSESEKIEDDEATDTVNPPTTSGRVDYSASVKPSTYAQARKGRHGRRRRAAGVRPSAIAKSFGAAAALKRRERHKLGYIADLAPAAASVADDAPAEFAELSGTQAAEDMEEDSGAAREDDENMGGNDEEKTDNHHDGGNNNSDAAGWDVEEEYDEQTQNGDTEVLDDDDGNGEDSSGRQEDDEPGAASPGVRDNNHVMNDDANGMLEGSEAAVAAADAAPTPPHGFSSGKSDLRDHSTSRVADGEKDHHRHSMPLVREVSMNGRRGGDVPGVAPANPGGVRGWLSSLGLDKYGDVFEENEVDDHVLHLLTFEDLKEMGVMAVGARRKMFSAIQELGATSLSGR